MAWLASLGNTVRKGFRIERAFADPWAVARAVLAVAVGAALGGLLDDLLALTMISVGTFICGIGTLLTPVRHRFVNATATGAVFSAAVVLGVFLHPAGWYFLLFLAAASFTAGIWRTLGIGPGIRACLVVIGVMVTADVSPGLGQGLLMARWIAVGAALVAAVQLLPPYGRRHPAQRRALAAVYGALAAHAREGRAGAAVPSAPFTAARTALEVLPQFARPTAAPLFGLLGEAERIRRTLSSAIADLPRQAVAAALDAVAAATADGRPPRLARDARRALDGWTGPAAEALRPRLDEAARLAVPAEGRRGAGGAALPEHTEVPGLYAHDSVAVKGLRRLRAELHPQAPLFLHAVRLAVGTTAAEAAGRLIGDFWGHGLPQHGFWAALTTMLVLFPDYEHTFARGWARPVGSVVGGLLAWAMLLGHWNSASLGAAAVVFSALCFALLRTGQSVLNVFITAWIVFLIHHMGTNQAPIAWGRPADTVLGSLIALAVFLLLPTWHHRRVPGVLARWTRLLDRLLPDLLTGYADVSGTDPAVIDTLRDRSRRLREELAAAVAKVPGEPHHHRAAWDPEGLERIAAAVDTLAHRTSLLVDRLPRSDAEAVPELAAFAGPLHAHLSALARAAAGAEPVRPGALREAFAERVAGAGLARLADPDAADGVAHARARALAPWLHTVEAVEELTAAVAGRARPHRSRGRAGGHRGDGRHHGAHRGPRRGRAAAAA